MRRIVPTSLLALAVLAGAYAWHVERGGAKDHETVSLDGAPIAWHEDLAEAREIAARTKRPLMLLFRCEP
jgi:hypothetical protein